VKKVKVILKALGTCWAEISGVILGLIVIIIVLFAFKYYLRVNEIITERGIVKEVRAELDIGRHTGKIRYYLVLAATIESGEIKFVKGEIIEKKIEVDENLYYIFYGSEGKPYNEILSGYLEGDI